MHEAASIPSWVLIAYLASGVCFILALRGLSSPDSSRRGNIIGMFGMAKYVQGGTTLIWGLRVETTNFTSQAPTVSGTGAVSIANGKTGYVDVFPNVTLRQAFTPALSKSAISRSTRGSWRIAAWE